MIDSVIGPVTQWLTQWLTKWLTQWLSDWICDSVIDSVTQWLVQWLSDWISDSVIDSVINSVTQWLTQWLIHWPSYWLIYWPQSDSEWLRKLIDWKAKFSLARVWIKMFDYLLFEETGICSKLLAPEQKLVNKIWFVLSENYMDILPDCLQGILYGCSKFVPW